MYKHIAFAFRRAVARVHTARLPVTAVRTARNFTVQPLPRQPDLKIIGLARAGTHVTRAQQHLAIWQLKCLQNTLGTFDHTFMFRNAVFGANDGNQLHLFKLVLADQAFRIASGRARFRTETGRQCGHTDGQRALVQNLFAHAVGQRNFGGWDKPTAIGRLKIVFGKFWKLSGAKKRFLTHQIGRGAFCVTALSGLVIQHELTKRAIKPRHLSAHEGEARTGNCNAGFEIEAKYWAQIGMIARFKCKTAWGSPPRYFNVFAFICAVRCVVCRQIG